MIPFRKILPVKEEQSDVKGSMSNELEWSSGCPRDELMLFRSTPVGLINKPVRIIMGFPLRF